MLKLSCGEYLGHNLSRRTISGLPLTVTSYPAERVYPWHVHESPTLFLLLSGEHRGDTRTHSFHQPPLSVVFQPNNGPHATTIGLKGVVGLNLELIADRLVQLDLDPRELPDEYRILNSSEAQFLGLRLLASAFDSDEAAQAESDTAVLELLSLLVPRLSASERAPRWLNQALEYLQVHCHTSVCLSDVAREVGIHPVYCARAFRKGVGCTVLNYLRVLRLVGAVRLILHQGLTLAEAAMRAGFADQSHMTRTCTNTLRVAPGRLRGLINEWLLEPSGSSCSRRMI